jgi:hypothetical protein
MIAKAIEKLPREVRYRAQNALEGFRRAHVLLPIDREMSSFRAITAEEEAVACLFRALQFRGYPGASSLSLKLHQHKSGAVFFLAAVRHEIVRAGNLRLIVTVSPEPPSVTVALPLSQFLSVDGKLADAHLELAEPLGFVHSTPNVDEFEHFDAAVAKVADGKKVDKLIDGIANARNKILYAHDTGLPVSRVDADGIAQRERTADLFLLLAIAVLQVEGHQAMATQCLRGFLKVIGRLPPGTV